MHIVLDNIATEPRKGIEDPIPGTPDSRMTTIATIVRHSLIVDFVRRHPAVATLKLDRPSTKYDVVAVSSSQRRMDVDILVHTPVSVVSQDLELRAP
jgi:hypothetical protein